MNWMSRCTALLFLLALTGAAAAHEGHDHAEQQLALPAETGAARSSASSELYELVAVLEGERLRLYLDRWADNSPVTDARIEVEGGSWKGLASREPDGSYLVAAAPLARSGQHDLVFTIHHGADDDLLQSTLEVHGAAVAATSSSRNYWLVALALLVISLLIFFVLWRKRS